MALGALQAQNTVTVNNVELKKGSSVLVSVELANELAFTAFQVDLKLPDGFDVATMINEDEEEVLDVTLNASRKKSTHLVAPNVLDDGTIRIAAYSSTNATFKGTSGEIVSFRIVATDEVAVGDYTATLSKMLFSTSDPVAEYDLGQVDFQITYSEEPVIVIPNRSVAVNAGQYGRCIFGGNVIEPNGSYVRTEAFKDGSEIKFYFIPFEGYQVSSMKRNGVPVAVRDNMYEETATEDVVFSDVDYITIVDTLVVIETVVDTLVVKETVVDTLVVTETVVDTLVVKETVVDTLVVTDTVVIEKVDTVVIEKVEVDTLIITEIEELPTPVITCENGVVTITCEETDVTILYAINGDPLEGSVYTAPFEVAEDAVVSAVAVRRGDKAELSVQGTGVAQSRMRVVSRRYYSENGMELTSPEDGVTIVAAEYEDGSTRVFKMVKK